MRWPPGIHELLLIAAVAVTATPIDDYQSVDKAVLEIANNLTLIDHDLHFLNGTNEAAKDDGTVRKKRTFGDLVFRGLADVLGYSVQRRPPETSFPPPVAPLPQFSFQVTATQAAPAACGAAPQADNPCGRANKQQQAATPPCARRQVAQNPCNARARAAAPPPCDAPAPAPTRAADVVSSNFQLNFAFNRNNPQAQAGADAALPAADPVPTNVPFNPGPARLPPPPKTTRKPKVFIDAFVVNGNGKTQKVNTVDAAQYDPEQYDYDQSDYRDAPPPSYDYYEDVQESQNQRVPDKSNRYAPSKYSNRGGPWSQSISLPPPPINKIPIEEKRKYNPAERIQGNIHNDYLIPEDPESTTSTEDPQTVLVPRILPHTENHPNQIDTITVRVPPIYKVNNPKKLHQADDDDGFTPSSVPLEERRPPRRRKKKKIIKIRSRRHAYSNNHTNEASSAESYNPSSYNYGKSGKLNTKKTPIERRDSDYSRLEATPPEWSSEENSYRVDESERDDSAVEKYRTDESERDDSALENYRADERERDNSATPDPQRSDERERGNPGTPDPYRAGDEERRNTRLSPSAVVYEDGYSTSFAKVVAKQVDDNKPKLIRITRRKLNH